VLSMVERTCAALVAALPAALSGSAVSGPAVSPALSESSRPDRSDREQA